MKFKKLSLIAFSGILAMVFAMSSCDKDFDEYNHDPYALTETELASDYRLVGEPFINTIRNIYVQGPAWITQLQQNLLGDVYSGYMMPPTPFAGNSNNMNYNFVDGWNTWAWNPAYTVMSNVKFVGEKGKDFPEFIAWMSIVKVAAMHRLSDMFGPIIYSEFGKVAEDGTIPYDCQDKAYDLFFKDLDSGIAGLTSYLTANPTTKPFTAFDEVYAGDISKWIKLANSMRLRLAIRISKVDPARAKAEGEKALANSYGVITENGDNFVVKTGLDHPLNVMSGAWNDTRMGAPMESILKGYKDPRLGAFFEPSKQFPGDYKGIRQGIAIASKGQYENFSALKKLGDVQLMTAAEVTFLRAEAALRGWNGAGGSAKELYELGVTTSFTQYGASGVTAYLADATSKPIPYVDPVNAVNSVDASSANLSKATIAWDESASTEGKLEKIITQKWIAMFPDGQEAWSEYRRTGYPKLFPVVINNSGGTIDTEKQVKRVKFIGNEYAQNPKGVASGVACLKGPDTGGTNLWWDVD
ncbi:MAG: SusD/RagB family nutrient-binding outer membrane lipoprotein [Saprospiraceae bacterium]|nr:SusD/RagB family nutrient-binding outer membrane lipoprotein [Saprospiraceae bacterium]